MDPAGNSLQGHLKAYGKSKGGFWSSHMLSDALEGGFLLDPFNQNVKYTYNIDSLTIKDLYEISGYLGKIHASYLYDFFMNQYVIFHLPPGFPPPGYYHYNRVRNSFVVVEDERFEILDPTN